MTQAALRRDYDSDLAIRGVHRQGGREWCFDVVRDEPVRGGPPVCEHQLRGGSCGELGT